MSRPIEEFHGQNLVIGCSHLQGYCRHPGVHIDSDKFYTIDVNREAEPDMLCDITQPIPDELLNRFKVIFAEGLPYDVYNLVPGSEDGDEPVGSELGLQHMLDMLQKDGLLILSDCPKKKPSRASLIETGLRYFEAYSTRTNDCDIVIVSKKRNISVNKFRSEIEQWIEPPLRAILSPEMWHKEYKWSFCAETLDTIPAQIEFAFASRMNRLLSKSKQEEGPSYAFNCARLRLLQNALGSETINWQEIESKFVSYRGLIKAMISYFPIIVDEETSLLICEEELSYDISDVVLLDIDELIRHPFIDLKIRCLGLIFRILSILFMNHEPDVSIKKSWFGLAINRLLHTEEVLLSQTDESMRHLVHPFFS